MPENKPTIYLGADHAGFALKEKIKSFLIQKDYIVEDCGAFVLEKDDDYPDFVSRVADGVSKIPGLMGIIIGGSGTAEAITANRFKKIRCALFYGPVVAVGAVDVHGKQSHDPFGIVRLAREHNDANMLSLGARFLDEATAEQAVMLFIETQFSQEERHKRRIEKIEKYG